MTDGCVTNCLYYMFAFVTCEPGLDAKKEIYDEKVYGTL